MTLLLRCRKLNYLDERGKWHAHHMPTDTPTGSFARSGAVMASYHTHGLLMKA